MNDDGFDGVTMIGLHRLAAGEGDGLVPELYSLLMQKDEAAPGGGNVVPFPLRRRLPSAAVSPAREQICAEGGNVVAFRRRAGKNHP